MHKIKIEELKFNYLNQSVFKSILEYLYSKYNKNEISSFQTLYNFSLISEVDISSFTIYQKLLESNIYCQNNKFYIICLNPFDEKFLQEFTKFSFLNLTILLCDLKSFNKLKNTEINSNLQTTKTTPLEIDSNFATNLLETLFIYATTNRASDIHFESTKLGIQIKLRVDGVMIKHHNVEDNKQARQIISRLKVLALLDITEQRVPQDGRFRWESEDNKVIDFRISVIPSIHGEDAVLRILDKSHLWRSETKASLDSLGIDQESLKTIRDLVKRPYGMLLVTGPTGSGKTTTIYGALAEINHGKDKIITIEDPVEYEMYDVLQIPVNEKKGLTFATGLRSILRHDPDKILIGEIRDAETAQIAVQSALTGHVVFTTVHANSFIDVLGRFQHFNIDPFSFASAINGVVVQRLLRVLCDKCKTKSPSILTLNTPNLKKELSCHYLPSGCEHCYFTGYKGRVAVAETHFITDEMRDVLIDKPNISILKKLIYKNNNDTLVDKALLLVENGVTTYEEFERIVGLF